MSHLITHSHLPSIHHTPSAAMPSHGTGNTGTMSTLQDLLPPPILSTYIPCFIESGYDDITFIMSLSQHPEWDTMMTAVTQAGERIGVYMKHGHIIQIMSRLRAEKTRRQQADMMQNMIQNNVQLQQQQQQSNPLNVTASASHSDNAVLNSLLQHRTPLPPPLYNGATRAHPSAATGTHPPPHQQHMHTHTQSQSQIDVTNNLRVIREERDRRRRIRMMKRNVQNAQLKSVAVDVDISRPIMDTGQLMPYHADAYGYTSDAQPPPREHPQHDQSTTLVQPPLPPLPTAAHTTYPTHTQHYITLELNDPSKLGYSNATHTHWWSCYYYFSRHWSLCALLFLILLIVGIVLYVSSHAATPGQGVATAALMFACVTCIMACIQFTRRDIHRSECLDSLECCTVCQRDMEGVCMTCTCCTGLCATTCTCGDQCGDSLADCGSIMKECALNIQSAYSEVLLWITATWLSIKACTRAVTSCDWLVSCFTQCCDSTTTTDCFSCCRSDYYGDNLCTSCSLGNCMDGDLCNTDGECTCMRCSGPHSVCAEVGCAECSLDSCAGACDDIDMSDCCECDCLPQVEGIKGCFNTCIKIACCQCKIQIA